MKGQVKELFDEWYVKNAGYSEKFLVMEWFFELTESMQWGVLQDFYDSKGFYISQKAEGYKPIWYDYIIKHGLEVEFSRHFKTRPEARKAALQKAEELLEEKL